MTEIEDRIKRLSEPFDQAMIQYKPKGGRQMAFVSHGLVNKRLNKEAPGWSSRIIASGVDVTQNPKGGLLYTADVTLELTVAGVTRAEVGTNNQPVADRGQALKSAASDALKRAAMRFGVALDLWESLDEQDEDAHYAATPRAGTTPGREPAPRSTPQRPTPSDRPAATPNAAGPPSAVTPAEEARLMGRLDKVDAHYNGDKGDNGGAKAAKRVPTFAEARQYALDETISAKGRLRAATIALELAGSLDELADTYSKVMALPERQGLQETYETRHKALKELDAVPL
jgi:hypothetical protein